LCLLSLNAVSEQFWTIFLFIHNVSVPPMLLQLSNLSTCSSLTTIIACMFLALSLHLPRQREAPVELVFNMNWSILGLLNHSIHFMEHETWNMKKSWQRQCLVTDTDIRRVGGKGQAMMSLICIFYIMHHFKQ
jgi:hypothetical protein